MKPLSLVSLLLLSLLLFKAQGRLYNEQSFKHGVGEAIGTSSEYDPGFGKEFPPLPPASTISEAVTTSIGTSRYDPGLGIAFPPLYPVPPGSTLNDYDLPHFPPGSFSPDVPPVSTSSEYDPGFGIFPPLPPGTIDALN